MDIWSWINYQADQAGAALMTVAVIVVITFIVIAIARRSVGGLLVTIFIGGIALAVIANVTGIASMFENTIGASPISITQAPPVDL